MNFNSYISLTEDFEQLDSVPVGKINVSLFSGRFQPFHKGHLRIIKNILNNYPKYKVLVGIVKGAKTSQNKQLNPLSFDYQRKLIIDSLSDLKSKVIVFNKPFKSGYLPKIFEELRLSEYEVKVFASGGDRAEAYKTQISKMNEAFRTINIDFLRINRTEESSTKIREAIRTDNFELFKKLTSPGIWDEFENLKRRI